jgi:hypothetical protein
MWANWEASMDQAGSLIWVLALALALTKTACHYDTEGYANPHSLVCIDSANP